MPIKPPLVFCSLLLVGCVNYQGIHRHEQLMKPSQFATKKSLKETNGKWPSSDWVQTFKDPELSKLVQEAVANNPDVHAAFARYQKATAITEQANAALYPQLNFNALASRTKAAAPFSTVPSWQNLGFYGLRLSHEFDFWGKNYSTLEQTLSTEVASQAMLYSAKLSISTWVATLYNQLNYEYGLKAVLTRTVAQRKKFVDITKLQVRSGLGTNTQIYQAQTQLAAAKTDLDSVEGQIAVTREQLGVLLGKGPDRGYAIKTPKLTNTPTPDLPNQLPLNLIGRRPDVFAARMQVQSSVASVKNMKAQFYPNVNLSAIAARYALGQGRLFSQPSTLLAVTPAVSLPIFDAGLLRAQLKERYAVLDEQIALYNSSLNQALGEVAQNITTIHSLNQQRVEQQAALTSAKKAFELSHKQYQIGLTSQLVVLDAQVQYLGQQQLYLLLQKQRRDAEIALIHALGGGFREETLRVPRTTASPNRTIIKDEHVA